jgi:hypothetical protein
MTKTILNFEGNIPMTTLSTTFGSPAMRESALVTASSCARGAGRSALSSRANRSSSQEDSGPPDS